jgi:hypothetical protein
LTACNLQESRVDINFSGFDNVHLLGDNATHSPAPRSPCHAALQILAIPPGIAVVCALPGTPITALASAFNYGF